MKAKDNNSSISGLSWLWLFVSIFITMLVVTAAILYVRSVNSNKLLSSRIEIVSIDIPHTIVALGDIVCDPESSKAGGVNTEYCQEQQVVQGFSQINPERILLLGDNQYENGSLQKYNSAFKSVFLQYSSMLLPSPGNHEYETPEASGYFNYFNGIGVLTGAAGSRGQGYYHTKIGNWSVYSLNSNCQKIGGCAEDSQQYGWLKNELSNDKSICKLAYWHHPLFSSGKHGDDPEETNRMPKIWQLLNENKVTLVLNGHDHVYERFALQNYLGQASANGMREFIIGTGGKELYTKSTAKPNSEFFYNHNFGFLELTLQNNSYSWRFHTVSNQIIDQGNGSCINN